MAEKKITKREKFELIKQYIDVGEDGHDYTEEEAKMLIEFIDHEIELISRKSSKSAKGEEEEG